MKKILICLVLGLTFLQVSGQVLLERVPEQAPLTKKQEIPAIRERLFFGGDFWLSVAPKNTNIHLAPVVGLWVLPKLAVAVGPEYSYINDLNGPTSVFGAKSYVQFVLIKDMSKFLPFGMNTGIFLHLEDDLLNIDYAHWYYNVPAAKRSFMNNVLGGAGISQQVGPKSYVNFMVLWSLLESDPELSPQFYTNPEFRIGFIF